MGRGYNKNCVLYPRLELMKLIFAVLDVSLTMGLTRCYKTEGFFYIYTINYKSRRRNKQYTQGIHCSSRTELYEICIHWLGFIGWARVMLTIIYIYFNFTIINIANINYCKLHISLKHVMSRRWIAISIRMPWAGLCT